MSQKGLKAPSFYAHYRAAEIFSLEREEKLSRFFAVVFPTREKEKGETEKCPRNMRLFGHRPSRVNISAHSLPIARMLPIGTIDILANENFHFKR